MIARYQRRPRVGRRMYDGHKLAVDAGVGADGRRSTMTSTRSRSRSSRSTLRRRFPLTLASQLRRRLPLEPFSSKPTLPSSDRPELTRTASTRTPAQATTNR